MRGAAVEGCGGGGGESELSTLMSPLGTWSMRRNQTDCLWSSPLLPQTPHFLTHFSPLVLHTLLAVALACRPWKLRILALCWISGFQLTSLLKMQSML